MLKLFCYVRGDPSSHVFTVNINEDETLHDLSAAIKELKRHKFDDVLAESLLLWRVSVQYSQNLKEDVEALDLGQA
jgi:hypothetical protein